LAGFRFPSDVIVLAVRWYLTDRYANNRVECDQGRLKAWLADARAQARP
jgi:hypothetical protein